MSDAIKPPRLYAKAVAWFLRRLGLSKDELTVIKARAAAQAKQAAAFAQLRMVQQLWESSLQAEQDGMDFAAWQTLAIAELRAAWGKDGSRAETVYQVQVQRALTEGRMTLLRSETVRRLWPYWMFEAVMDDRVGWLCHSLYGVIRPAGEPWWDRRVPPLHPRCRSHLRGLTSEEAHRRGVTPYYPEQRAHPGWGQLKDDWTPTQEGVPPALWAIFKRAIEEP